ncbi:MAG TPA: metal-dependent transcriptional regulator [Polyangia bacterium]|nr:metal-dependent transcriptional regulator [Polyangia bacterium]
MRDRLEDVLEAILMARELGDTTLEKINLGRAEDACSSVDEVDLDELIAGGFAARDGAELSLTPSGLAIAEHTVRRHRLTEMLLYSLLGLDRDLASEIGCKVEHGIREEMVDGVCTLLGHPQVCPHGRTIPPGQCCRDGRRVVESQVVPLTDLRPGERARIVYITPRDHHRLHRLSSMGLNPGIEIELHQRNPAFCLRVDETELALDRDVAGDIQVSRLAGGNGR